VGALALIASLLAVAASATTAGAAKLRKPGKVRVDRVATESIKLKWKDRARGERHYVVRGREQGASEWDSSSLGRNKKKFVDKGLEPGTVYEYRVRACKGHRCSGFSPTRRQATLLAPFNGPHPSPNCPVFPASDAWNEDVTALPTDPNSADYMNQILADGGDDLHPDFGSNPDYGIPFVVVPGDQPRVGIKFDQYGDESDPGPYPVPPRAPIESGSDHHVLVVERPDSAGGNCTLYETYASSYDGGVKNRWTVGAGAVFNLGAVLPQRPEEITSADAAGLPIFPGLVRHEEVEGGLINHAIRITFDETQAGYMHPATHLASSSDNCNRPPMGLRMRLNAGWFAANAGSFTGPARVVLNALRRYGTIVADNGSNFFITGSTDRRWEDENLNQLKNVPGTAFEVVDTGEPIRPADSPCAG
jgi:hypothetical protein